METNFDFSNFEFRSHYMGELMTPAKGKSAKEKYENYTMLAEKNFNEWDALANRNTKKADALFEKHESYEKKAKLIKPYIDVPHFGEKCKTRLMQIYTEATTGRIKNIQNHFIEKGLHTEEEGITQYALYKGEMFKKNKVRAHNGFIQGEMDFEEDEDTSVDNKSSWDVFTFDTTAVKKMHVNYEWQGQCYMWLFNKKKHRVLYSLINTPKFLLDQQLSKLKYQVPDDQYEEAREALIKLNIYDDLPIERKVRVYDVFRSDENIEKMKTMIPQFRWYLNNIDKANSIDNEQEDD